MVASAKHMAMATRVNAPRDSVATGVKPKVSDYWEDNMSETFRSLPFPAFA